MQVLNNSIVYLDKNENIYGPSPECYNIMNNITTEDLAQYSRNTINILQSKIALIYNFPINQIILNYGNEDLIRNIFSGYVFSKDKVMLPSHSWWYYNVLSKQRNAEIITYLTYDREKKYSIQIDKILELEKNLKPRLTIICSPNNPTGHIFILSHLEKLLKINRDRIVFYDETYWGFTKKDNTLQILEFVNRYDNLIVGRSFSKYYALAGIRIAFAFCGKKVREYLKFSDRILGFNCFSEKLALTALNSKNYYKKTSGLIIHERDLLFNELSQIKGIKTYESQANFILLRFPENWIQPLDLELKKQGLLIKFFSEKNFLNYARITIGKSDHMRLILNVIKQYSLKQSIYRSVNS